MNGFKKRLQKLHTDGLFLFKPTWPLGPTQISGKILTDKILVRSICILLMLLENHTQCTLYITSVQQISQAMFCNGFRFVYIRYQSGNTKHNTDLGDHVFKLFVKRLNEFSGLAAETEEWQRVLSHENMLFALLINNCSKGAFLGSSNSGIHRNIPSARFIELFFQKLAVYLLNKRRNSRFRREVWCCHVDAAEEIKHFCIFYSF